MAEPAGPQEPTAKMRIRNAALDLYAARGEDGTSMRRTADAAGVTVGLVVHHFGTKDRLREAVEEHVVDLFAEAIASVPDEGGARAVAGARDEAVMQMLAAHPSVVGYLRRAVLGLSGRRSDLLRRLTNLTVEQVAHSREAGLASRDERDSHQVIRVMTRQLGQLLLQPMIDAMWSQLEESESLEPKPVLVVRVDKPSE